MFHQAGRSCKQIAQVCDLLRVALAFKLVSLQGSEKLRLLIREKFYLPFHSFKSFFRIHGLNVEVNFFGAFVEKNDDPLSS